VSIAFIMKVKELERRVAAIEKLLTEPKPLARRNMQRQATGARLRSAVEGVIATRPMATAKEVLKALSSMDLGRQALPSVRTIQWHLTVLRTRQGAPQ
jgi:hypothetical protein